MPATFLIKNNGDIMDQLVLSTVEDIITISAPPLDPMHGSGKSKSSIKLWSDQAWYYANITGVAVGPSRVLIGPYQVQTIEGVSDGQKIYVAAVAATPTLYAQVSK